MNELPIKQNKVIPFEQTFVQDTHDANVLLRKELTVNLAEQNLLKQRMQLMREFLNDLPSKDPQYSMIALAIQADQVELDELELTQQSLLQKMEKTFKLI